MTSSIFSSVLVEPLTADDIPEQGHEGSRLAPARHWSLATRITFRFVFVYFGLYCAPTILGVVPYINHLSQKYFDLLVVVVPWVARHILHVQRNVSFAISGSGDTTFDYIEIFLSLLVATFATIIWSLLDRKRPNYQKLHQGLRYLVRFYLGSMMLMYGAMKVVPDQMSAPSLVRLLEPIGDASPMGLLWTFIGASRPYETFCGATEMLGGILLFVPALTTLGALVCIGALTNVFMLNMCYDVPVKMLSLHLLLMAVFLVAPNLKALVNLFVFHRPTKSSADRPLSRRKWLNQIAITLQVLCGIALAAFLLNSFHKDAKRWAAKSPYYGIWSVEEYAVDGKVVPPSLTEVTRWRRVILDSAVGLGLQLVDGPLQRFSLDLDQGKQSFKLMKRDDEKWSAQFSYQHPQEDILIFDGQLDGHHIHAHLRRGDHPKFPLTSAGFHWIREYPNQR